MKTLKQLAQEIKKDNDAFDNLSKAEKRVAIARDCIERIKLSQFNADTGAIVGGVNLKYYQEACNVKDVLNSDDKFNCRVCAKGGLFMSYLGRVNNFDFTRGIEACEQDNNTPNMLKLMEIFSDKQLIYIETAFEGYQVIGTLKNFDSYSLPNDKYNKAKAFNETFDMRDENGDFIYNENAKLIAICENIIKNKGTFKL